MKEEFMQDIADTEERIKRLEEMRDKVKNENESEKLEREIRHEKEYIKYLVFLDTQEKEEKAEEEQRRKDMSQKREIMEVIFHTENRLNDAIQENDTEKIKKLELKLASAQNVLKIFNEISKI